jgi:Xaa-Pro aminopeptidase
MRASTTATQAYLDGVGRYKREALTSSNPPLEAPFSLAEYADRLRLTRAAMADAGIDCLYLTAPESIHYLTGFASEWYQANGPAAWAPASGIAIHVDHEDLVQFETYEEVGLVELTSVAREVRYFDVEGPELIDAVVPELAALGWLGSTVGLELRSYRPHRAASEAFQAALERHGCTIRDGTGIVRGLRRRKSSQELAYVRTAQRIADIGMAAARESLAPGVTELAVYGAMVQAMAAAGGEVAAIPLPVVSGPRAATVHGLASRRVLMPGDVVDVDISGVYQRYHANMARCFCLGEPDAVVAERVGHVTAAVDVVERVLRPRLPVRELLETVEEYYRENGLLGDEWWVGGYELGVAFAPDWVGDFEYTLGTDPGEEVFASGEVCNYEGNFYLPHNLGLALSINTFAVTDDAASFLQTTPSELIVIP